MNEEIKKLIAAADKAIKEERFDDLMEYYTDDAVLVVKPGMEAHGQARDLCLPQGSRQVALCY